MARIFLSYARADAARAQRIAVALEQAGHDVWWDREISAGSSFSNEIDIALKDAELVVVLWSRHSISSDWVRDEAANGRDSGRLLPALIEAVDPPLGFRQYQAVVLPTRGRQPVQPLIDAVEKKLGSGNKTAPPRAQAPVVRGPSHRLAIAAAVALLMLVTAAGAWWFTRPDGASGLSIAVVASSGSPGPSRELAQSLSRDLGRFRAGPLGSLTIVEGDDAAAAHPAYRVEVGVSGSGAALQADVALKQGGSAGLLWSSLVPEPHGRMIDLRQQVSAQVGDVLNCLAELGGKERTLKPDSLSLFLRGCALGNDGEAVAIFQELVKREPKFGHGWAGLALVASWQVPEVSDAERRRLINIVRDSLAQAKIYGPDLAETAVADANSHPSGGKKILRTLQLMDNALVHNPNSPLLRGTRTDALQALGRMTEAVAESQRASNLNPLSPALLDAHASALAYSGNIDAAFRALEEAEKSWPGSARLADARYRLDLRYGDPAKAAEYLKFTNYFGDKLATLAYLKARAEPSEANIDRALAAYRARYEKDPVDVPAYFQALAIFGRIDEAFAAATPAISVDSIGASSDVLFRSYMNKLRDDPRFMLLAQRIGLVDDWRATGVWPDFCAEPALPYDCKAEAAKWKSVPTVPSMGGAAG
ncbi:MAG: toll/interleukin-1 receptor domain-containing protein [Sphingomicrobium sp.]